MKRLSFKTQFSIEFLQPFIGKCLPIVVKNGYYYTTERTLSTAACSKNVQSFLMNNG